MGAVSSDRPFYTRGHDIPIRPRQLGTVVWTLPKEARVMTCELRDHRRVGAGVEVQLLEGDELLLARQCLTMGGATFVAESLRQDHLRTRRSELV
jgi:hypothetical protein